VLFMIIERFRNQDAKAVYARFREHGRLAPEGLAYVGSWVEASLDRCFQLMECDDVTLLQQWVAQWSDLVEFEIIPVVPGKETAAALARGHTACADVLTSGARLASELCVASASETPRTPADRYTVKRPLVDNKQAGSTWSADPGRGPAKAALSCRRGFPLSTPDRSAIPEPGESEDWLAVGRREQVQLLSVRPMRPLEKIASGNDAATALNGGSYFAIPQALDFARISPRNGPRL
jgi:hypothetical protein